MKKSISIILLCIGLIVSSLEAMKSESKNPKQEPVADEMLPVEEFVKLVVGRGNLSVVQKIASLPLHIRRRLISNERVRNLIIGKARFRGNTNGILSCLLENLVAYDDSPSKYMCKVLGYCVGNLLSWQNKNNEETLNHVIKLIETHKEKYIGCEESIRRALTKWHLDSTVPRDLVERIKKKLCNLTKKIEDTKKKQLQQVIKDLEEIDIT